MRYKILQWNRCGLKANYNELIILPIKLNPVIICLQETFLKNEKEINFREYQQYNYIKNAKHKTCGGVSILRMIYLIVKSN